MSPVFSRIISVSPSSLRLSQYSEVRRSCHTMALYTGSEVSASQTMVVSRWLVMPMAAIFLPLMPIEVMASAITAASEDHISIGLCSTQPGFGKYCVNSFWLLARLRPDLSKTMALELLVPWSRARITLSIYIQLCGCREYVQSVQMSFRCRSDAVQTRRQSRVAGVASTTSTCT